MPAVVDYLERQAAIVTGQHHSLLQARRIDDPAANTVNALLQRGGYLQAKFQHASARCGRQRDAATTDLQPLEVEYVHDDARRPDAGIQADCQTDRHLLDRKSTRLNSSH